VSNWILGAVTCVVTWIVVRNIRSDRKAMQEAANRIETRIETTRQDRLRYRVLPEPGTPVTVWLYPHHEGRLYGETITGVVAEHVEADPDFGGRAVVRISTADGEILSVLLADVDRWSIRHGF
jgi:hypothetical protein